MKMPIEPLNIYNKIMETCYRKAKKEDFNDVFPLPQYTKRSIRNT